MGVWGQDVMGWRGDLMALVAVMWFVYPVIYLAYLIAAPVRHFRRRHRWLGYERKSVRFHARWGIVLSLPGLGISVLGGFGDKWHWIGGVTLIATLVCWDAAFDAAAGRPIRTWQAWAPLVVVLFSVNAIAALAGFPPHYGDSSTALDRYLGSLVMFSGPGIGLVAWVVVSVNFALSVRKEARIQNAPGSAPAPVPAPTPVPATTRAERQAAPGSRLTWESWTVRS